MTSTTLPRITTITPDEAASERPSFSVLRDLDGEWWEYATMDFPVGCADCSAATTVERFLGMDNCALVARNAAAVDVLVEVLA